jgi:hypothetical protein
MTDNELRKIHENLEDIKSLLILIASKYGASQGDIRDAVGVGARDVRPSLARKKGSKG